MKPYQSLSQAIEVDYINMIIQI